MDAYLAPLASSLFTLVYSQIVFKPDNEVGVVLFGTEATDNALHEEMQKRGKKGQYVHITELQRLDLPDQSYLASLDGLCVQKGIADYVNALTVAMDGLKRRLATKEDSSKYTRRILFFSDFVSHCKPAKLEFARALNEALVEEQIRLEVFVLAVYPQRMKTEEQDYKALLGITEADLSVRRITSEVELYSLFPVKPVAAATMYRGPLEISKDGSIPVRVFKKTHRETLPSLKPYSTRQISRSATHQVVRETEFKRLDDPSEPVPTDRLVKSYQYGPHFVPVSPKTEAQLQYVPVKGIRLKGFISKEQIPRHQYLKDCYIMLPDSDSGSQMALSALVQSCANNEKALLVQCALRKGSAVFLGVLTPFMEPEIHPDAFIMNVAPFSEDVRDYHFASFISNEALNPTEEQLQAMGQIVGNPAFMEMDDAVMPSDRAANPRLHRFHQFLGKRSIDALSEDVLSSKLFTPLEGLPIKGLEDVLTAATHLFKKQKTAQEEDED